jgi:membrane protein DedA with SNARE-associated domain/membrane-associated phospholipid phosphatase
MDGMESILETLFSWLPVGWSYYFLLFTVTFLESIVMVGLLVPGSTMIVFAGFLAAHGQGELLPVIIISVLGALAGDIGSFLLGARSGPQVRHSRLFKKRSHLFRKAELFFVAHGGKSLFFGRFMGPLRGMVPFVAGCTRMSPGHFLIYTLISSAMWGLVYPGLGYLGAASWQQIQRLTGRLSLLIGLLLVLFILNGLFWKKLFPRLVNRVGQFWPRISGGWQLLLGSPLVQGFAERFPRFWSFLAGRFSMKRGSGLYLTVGLALIALFSGIFSWLAQTGFLRNLDLQIHHLLSSQQHPLADHFLILVHSLAEPSILLLIGGFLFFWLVLYNRDFSAAILLVGLGGGQILIAFLQDFFARTGPAPFQEELVPLGDSFPGNHAFSALVLAGLLVYFLLDTVQKWRFRLGLIIGTSFIALLVGLSSCYLGINWLSDVLAGFILAAIWLTFLLTVLEIRRRYSGEFPWGTGWKPVQLSLGLRRLILAPALTLTFFAVLYYMYNRAF